jgi:hypothetical protein
MPKVDGARAIRSRLRNNSSAPQSIAERHPGRDLVLSRLVEVLLLESLRLTQTHEASAGLFTGLNASIWRQSTQGSSGTA